jgi:hypothetical protein
MMAISSTLTRRARRALSYLSASWPGGGREQEEGQDEDARRQVGQQRRRERRPAGRLEGEQHDQRVLEQVVVEGAEELGEEEGREALLFQESELTAHAWLAAKMRRVLKTAGEKECPCQLSRRFSVKSKSKGLCWRKMSRSLIAGFGSNPACARADVAVSGTMPGSRRRRFGLKMAVIAIGSAAYQRALLGKTLQFWAFFPVDRRTQQVE